MRHLVIMEASRCHATKFTGSDSVKDVCSEWVAAEMPVAETFEQVGIVLRAGMLERPEERAQIMVWCVAYM